MASTTDAAIEVKPAEWSGAAGERWAINLDRYEAMLAEAGSALLARAEFSPGLSVVEIGCGGGAISRAIAAEVGGEGEVIGVDISPALTAVSAERAADAGVGNARFITADATEVSLDAPVDRLVSRFGIMFFRDPPAAFANLRRLLKSGGRADFAVWAPPAENPAVSALPAMAARHIALPPSDPTAPGPFSLSDPEHFVRLLDAAGFSGTTMEKWQGNVHVGGGVGVDEAAQFAMKSSTLADVVAELSEELRQAILTDIRSLFAPFDGPDGVAIPSAVWMVTTYAP